MKKVLALFCTLACVTHYSSAANISTLQSVAQPKFRILSEDLGSALSYKPLAPAEPLGVTGFDLGLVVSSTDISRSSQIWSKATGNGEAISKVYVPKLQISKGLPLNLDVAAFYSKIPSTNISVVGGELRYAIIGGGVAMPAVSIRGAITKLKGVTQLALDTKSVDISVSKGFTMLTPYAGVGRVWVDSTPSSDTGLSEEKFKQSKVFVGANLNFGLFNMALEGDKTGEAKAYSVKLGFRF